MRALAVPSHRNGFIALSATLRKYIVSSSITISSKVNLRKRSSNKQQQKKKETAVVGKAAPTTPSKKRAKKKGNATKEATADPVEQHNQRPLKRRRKTKPQEEDMIFAPRVLGAAKWVGAHVSTAGGIDKAVLNARIIGANAFQIFVRSQRRWDCKPTPPDVKERFIQECKAHGYSSDHILVHGSYLVNLANPDPEKHAKSYEGFLDEIQRTHALGLKLYNFHPGSTTGNCSVDEGCSSIARSINKVHKEVPEVVCVLEIMAGGGNAIGGDYAHLKDIIEQVKDKTRVGVCLDTCHMFAAGYDIRTTEAWDRTMKEFDNTIGLKYLRGMHLNDSKTGIGSHRDRHENLGKGFIGWDAFKGIVRDPRTNGIPMVLETPVPKDDEDKEIYTGEVAALYKYYKDVDEKDSRQ
jgi:AP endonuclease-1